MEYGDIKSLRTKLIEKQNFQKINSLKKSA